MPESGWNEGVILDRDHLRGYTGGDTELAREVLKIFLQNAPDYLMTLNNSDCDSWRQAAHKLKGAARGIGAWRLARAAERAEFLGEPQSSDPRRVSILGVLDERLGQLRDHIETL